MPTVDVNIVVIANLVLDPPEVYLLPGTIIPLRLSQIRQGKAEIISLSSSQYYLEAEDPRVSSIFDNTGSIKVMFSLCFKRTQPVLIALLFVRP